MHLLENTWRNVQTNYDWIPWVEETFFTFVTWKTSEWAYIFLAFRLSFYIS